MQSAFSVLITHCPHPQVTLSLWAGCAMAALSFSLSSGPPQTNSGRDNACQECHRHTVTLRQLPGGNHAAAAGHVPREQAALGADTAIAAGSGPGRGTDRGDFQVSFWSAVLLLSHSHVSPRSQGVKIDLHMLPLP